jgi:hypothetical protein
MLEQPLRHSLQLQVHENLREELRKEEEHAADNCNQHDGEIATNVKAVSLFEDQLPFDQPDCSCVIHDSLDLSLREIVAVGGRQDLQTVLYTRHGGGVNGLVRNGKLSSDSPQ